MCDHVNDAQQKSMDTEIENMAKLNKKAQLPLPLRILNLFCMFVALIALTVLLRSIGEEVGPAEVFARAPYIVYGGGFGAIIWIALTVLSRKRVKTVMESDEATLTVNRSNAIAENALYALGVPPNTQKADFLISRYKNKGDKNSIKAWGNAQFGNAELFVYAEDGMLYLADVFQKFAVPMAEMTGIRKIKKRTTMHSWNKGTPHNKGEYKQYKINRGQYGEYHLRCYYALCIVHNGESHELYFPPYELEVLQKLTGLQAEE